MGIRQRSATAWEVNVAYKGERKFGTATSETEAKDLFVTLKAQLIQASKTVVDLLPQIPEAKHAQIDTTWYLKDAIKTAFDVKWRGTASEAFYEYECSVLTGHFGGDLRLSQITTPAVDEFRKKLIAKGNVTSTINKKLAALSMVFKLAHERGGVIHRPVMGMKKVDRCKVRYLSEPEELAMLGLFKQWGKDDLHDWLVVLVDTGLRPSELKRILPGWVDFKSNLLHIWVSKTKAGIRAIPMTRRVRATLEYHCLENAKDPMRKLFPTAYDVYTNVWERARKALKLDTDPDFTPYITRHTFATRLVQAGEQISIVQKLLGHETPAMTMIYAHFGADQYLKAISKLEKSPTDTVSKED